jgi:signal transduction histidine kinase
MPQISPTSFEDSLVDALPLPACICEAPSGLIMRSNARAVALWGQRPEPDTRIHDFLRFIRPDGVPLPPEAFPLAAAIDGGIAEANRQAVIDRRGQPSLLVRIDILPLNTVGQRRAGLMLFHSASERGPRREALLEERDRTDERLRFERSKAGYGYLAAFLEAERNATDDLLNGERAYADTVTAEQEGFLATVSHDLQTLLDGLAVSAALSIADAPRGEDGDKIRKHAGASQRAVARMTRLIGDLLDTASIQAGRLAITPKPVDVGKLVSDTLEAFKPIAVASDIDLDAALPAPPLSAIMDGQRIQQVLSNLVSNAIKFTPSGGRVSIRTRTTVERIQFAVTDTGIGIPENEMAGIFKRFQHARNERGGLGLGLHISKSIVEAHSGKIWAERGSVGSTFYVELPIEPVSGRGRYIVKGRETHTV